MHLYFVFLFFCIVAVDNPNVIRKNVVMPKRALSAFFWFTNDEREKVTAQHPKISAGDLARELGRRWNEADAKTRLKYEAIAEDDQIGYEREMAEYRIYNPDI